MEKKEEGAAMAQRKNRSSRKRRGGRRRFGFLYQFLSVVFICLAMVAGCIIFFKVDNVEVTGAEKYTGEQIVKASGVSMGDNLFLVNKFSVINRMFKQLPYLDEIMIRRRLPDTLVITVTECQPAAVVQVDNVYWVIDKKGKLLEKLEADPGTHAKLVGITPLTPVQGSYLTLAKDQPKDKLLNLLGILSDKKLIGHLSEIDLSDPAVIWLHYENRFAIKLDQNSDLHYKIEFLLQVLDSLQSNEKGTVDLTGDVAHFIPE